MKTLRQQLSQAQSRIDSLEKEMHAQIVKMCELDEENDRLKKEVDDPLYCTLVDEPDAVLIQHARINWDGFAHKFVVREAACVAVCAPTRARHESAFAEQANGGSLREISSGEDTLADGHSVAEGWPDHGGVIVDSLDGCAAGQRVPRGRTDTGGAGDSRR